MYKASSKDSPKCFDSNKITSFKDSDKKTVKKVKGIPKYGKN